MIMGAVPIAGVAGVFAYNKASAGSSTVVEAMPAVSDAPVITELLQLWTG